MGGKRTNKTSKSATGKKNSRKLTAVQKSFQKRAKEKIQPQAEQAISKQQPLADYLRERGEKARAELTAEYERQLREYISAHCKHPQQYEKLVPQLVKNHDIRITRLLTQIEREGKDCRVYQLKICSKNTSKDKRRALEVKFIEAKWCHNDVIRRGAYDYDPKPKEVLVHNKATGEDISHNYMYLTQQERQAICDQVKQDMTSLAKKKEKGSKVGKLRYVRAAKSIPLKQKGKTFDISEDTSSVLVAGIGWMPARGLEQVRGKDIANAVLVKCGSDYYLHVTVYQERKRNAKYHRPGTVTTADLGVGPAMTCSDSTIFDLRFEHTETYRKLCKKLSGQVVGSRGWWKTIAQIEHEEQKAVFARDDAANKTFAYFSMNETIITQDDPLPS